MYRTIPALLSDAASGNPDRVWLRTDDATVTFSEAVARVSDAADRLRAAGIRRDDLVVVTTRTTPPYLFCWLALASLAAVTVPTNPAGTPAELAGLIEQIRPRAVVTDTDLAPVLQRCEAYQFASLGVLDVADFVRAGSGAGHDVPHLARPDDPAVLIPTSGTTGRSKLVIQTHRAYALAGEGFPYWMELTEADRLMTSLPLFHINAPAYSVMGSLACGAGLVLIPRFSAGGFLDSARRHGATEFNAIGAMLEILMRRPERDDDAENPLRLCYTGPAPTRERQLEIESRFGLQIVCGYAMSETPYGLIWAHGTRPYGTLGSPRQHPRLGTVNRARVVNDVGEEVAVGATGELLLRNPAVTPGYWGMPEETSRVLSGGWLHTGDVVTANDDGTFTFVARTKEMLRRRGENLSPLEVEEAILAHPSVLECAVIGVASDLTEEDVKAFVVAVPGRCLDFQELRDWTAQRLAAFKVPRFWQQLDALPRTPTARVAKHRLPRDHPAEEHDAEQAPVEGAASD